MANIYVNPDGSGDGSSRDQALSTLQAAVDLAQPGDVILAAPETYEETVLITTSGTAEDHIVLRVDNGAGGGPGAVIDGTGYRRALAVLGAAYWDIYDFRLTNDQGDENTFIYGLEVTSDTGLSTGQGAHHIRFYGISVTGVNRVEDTDHYSVPVAIYSAADTGAGGTVTHDILMDGCAVYDCLTSDYPATTALELPLITVQGSVEDWALVRCKLHSTTINAGCVETGGPINSVPVAPLKGCMMFNELVATGDSYHTGTGLYCQGTTQILLLGNIATGFGEAYGVNTEPDADQLCSKTWVIGNKSVDCKCSLAAGPWDNTYDTVEDLYITNNTFLYDGNPPGGSFVVILQGKRAGHPGLAGDCRFVGNVLQAGDDLLYFKVPTTDTMLADCNVYSCDAAEPFTFDDVASGLDYADYQDRNSVLVAEDADLDAAAEDMTVVLVPTWWEPGIFGTYEPETYTSWNDTELVTPGAINAGI